MHFFKIYSLSAAYPMVPNFRKKIEAAPVPAPVQPENKNQNSAIGYN